MVAATLTTFSLLLSDFLKRSFKLQEDIVSLQPLANAEKVLPDNKVHLFLVNLERETGAGIKFTQQNISGEHYKKGSPTWQLNIYCMIATAFNEKQYEESLLILSGTMSFLQANNTFVVPQGDVSICVEPVNLSFNELSNLWGVFGSQYYPSVLCKLRTINIDSNEIKHIGRVITEKSQTIENE